MIVDDRWTDDICGLSIVSLLTNVRFKHCEHNMN